MNAASFRRVNLLKASLLGMAVVLAADLLALVETAKRAGPAFSGANGKIPFVSIREPQNPDIYAMKPDSTNQTNTPEPDGTPNWGRNLGAPSR